MDFDDLILQQGWDDDSVVSIMADFIHYAGLHDSLVQYAKIVARRENEQ